MNLKIIKSRREFVAMYMLHVDGDTVLPARSCEMIYMLYTVIQAIRTAHLRCTSHVLYSIYRVYVVYVFNFRVKSVTSTLNLIQLVNGT